MSTLPITSFSQVTYTIAPTAAPRELFLGLIIGPSSVISTTTRCVEYSSLAAMVTAGFSTGSPEYLAAQLYFSATSSPTTVVIGRQGSGESALQAVTACRLANSDWYGLEVTGASDADQLAVAAYIEACTPPSIYIPRNQDAAVLNNTTGNQFATLKASQYTRTFPLYSTFPHASAAILGYIAGQVTDADNSAFAIFGKQLPGVTPEALTTQQVSNIETNNGNVYVTRGNFYTLTEKGSMANGGWLDEIIYLDKLANDMQLNVADVLYQSTKVPQTEIGMGVLRTVVSQACADSVRLGFIAPGVWKGQQILNLNTGDTLSNGYLVQSDSIAGQNSADRSARKAPNIYVTITLAGAIQSAVVQIGVQR